MTKEQIKQELNRAKKQLENYKAKKRQAQNSLKEIYDLIDGLNDSIRKVESRLNDTLNVVKTKSSKLSPSNKFRNTYQIEANRILRNHDSNRALSKLQGALTKAKRKIIDNEDEIKEYNRKINNLTIKIEQLKQQLNQAQE